MNCRNCGAIVDPRRVELGYDYCTEPDCEQRCMDRLVVARVTVNKAADQFVRAEDVAAPAAAGGYSADEATDDRPVRRRGAGRRARKRTPSTLQRLRAAEAALDDQLRHSDHRFCRGEITAAAMKRQQNDAIERFNRQVMAENIRYRSLLRKRV